ncbi:MAG: DNA repair protein RecO [Rhodospirillaceae bacterium]
MEWTDRAIVLSARPWGETSALAVLLTACCGRHAGLVRGGRSRNRRPALEPGTLVSARWRARLPEQLGALTLEPLRYYGLGLLDQPGRLEALVAACALIEAGLSEREPNPVTYQNLLALFETLGRTGWAEAYVRWEVGLLAELGFGLDLSRCAVTGSVDDLVAVSPRTGRAVSRSAVGPWADRLLPLPAFLIGLGRGGVEEVRGGLFLTGSFLDYHLPHGLPPARRRFAQWYGRNPTKSDREDLVQDLTAGNP